MNRVWQTFLGLGVVAVLAAGCATSTVEKRKTERYGAYASFPPEIQALVDKGQIKVGMPMDAVYIAWGKPASILKGESSSGVSSTTWVYQGTTYQEYRYWSYRPGFYGRRYYPTPTLEYDYLPRDYISAEVVFENGVVKSWRTLAPP